MTSKVERVQARVLYERLLSYERKRVWSSGRATLHGSRMR